MLYDSGLLRGKMQLLFFLSDRVSGDEDGCFVASDHSGEGLVLVSSFGSNFSFFGVLVFLFFLESRSSWAILLRSSTACCFASFSCSFASFSSAFCCSSSSCITSLASVRRVSRWLRRSSGGLVRLNCSK